MIVECPGCRSRYDFSGRPPGTVARCRCGERFELPEPSGEAGLLKCPRCGGDAAPSARECRFCHAALLVKACPRCFARIWDGAEHCSQCGAAVTVPAHVDADGRAQTRKCPRCHERPELEARLVGDVLLDECGQCHGVFVDRTTLERVLAERDKPSLAMLGVDPKAAGAAPESGASRPEDRGRMYVPCPDCDGIMNRLNFGRRSGVIVDVCTAHGTWFDAQELSRVVSFVASGGLEESRRKDLQQLKAEADLARAKASAEPSRLYAGGGWDGELRRSPLEELLRFLWDLFP